VPELDKLRPRADEQDLTLVLVCDSGEEETKKFIEEINATLPVLVAPRGRTSFIDEYRSMGTPSFCLVDQRGRVITSGLGLMELEEMLRDNPESKRR
jgi:hypothetical protein